MTRNAILPMGLALFATPFVVYGYNKIQRLDEALSQARAQIEVQLQRRADLIPNLVEVVRGAADQESSILDEVVEARSVMQRAIESGSVDQMAEADGALSDGLARLLALVENYPDLRSSESFRALQDQVEGTENRIAVARSDYNHAVSEFNTAIRRFPTNVVAGAFGTSTPRGYFQTERDGADPPAVSF